MLKLWKEAARDTVMEIVVMNPNDDDTTAFSDVSDEQYTK
jgi:hypothetical protein